MCSAVVVAQVAERLLQVLLSADRSIETNSFVLESFRLCIVEFVDIVIAERPASASGRSQKGAVEFAPKRAVAPTPRLTIFTWEKTQRRTGRTSLSPSAQRRHQIRWPRIPISTNGCGASHHICICEI